MSTQTFKTKRMISFALIAMAALFLTYTYLVVTTTITITAKKQTAITMENLQSEVSDLELTYITRSNDITLDRAYELGFVAVGTTQFAYSNADDSRLALVVEN